MQRLGFLLLLACGAPSDASTALVATRWAEAPDLTRTQVFGDGSLRLYVLKDAHNPSQVLLGKDNRAYTLPTYVCPNLFEAPGVMMKDGGLYVSCGGERHFLVDGETPLNEPDLGAVRQIVRNGDAIAFLRDGFIGVARAGDTAWTTDEPVEAIRGVSVQGDRFVVSVLTLDGRKANVSVDVR